MSKEEAKVKTFDILHFVADNAGLSTFEAIEKAYNMGVSDQERILDKIRAEIIELRSKQNVGVCECLDIIDKYRAESEDEG